MSKSLEVHKWIDVLKSILIIILGNPIRRFCAALMIAGASLIGRNSILEVLIGLVSEKKLTSPEEHKLEQLAQYIGIIFVLLSVVFFFAHVFWEYRSKDKAVQRSILTAHKNGTPFSEIQLEWLERNPKKNEAFFSALANPEFSNVKRDAYLRDEWMKS